MLCGRNEDLSQECLVDASDVAKMESSARQDVANTRCAIHVLKELQRVLHLRLWIEQANNGAIMLI